MAGTSGHKLMHHVFDPQQDVDIYICSEVEHDTSAEQHMKPVHKETSRLRLCLSHLISPPEHGVMQCLMAFPFDRASCRLLWEL